MSEVVSLNAHMLEQHLPCTVEDIHHYGDETCRYRGETLRATQRLDLSEIWMARVAKKALRVRNRAVMNAILF